jgi:mRNA-degrading endonuclease RelE of RelBE toxin-antitoxin system
MRRSKASATVYSVEITPPAWTQLAHLTVETYRRIRDELDAVAALLTEGSQRAAPRRPAPSIVVDGAVALYDVDHERGRILLREVAPRRSQEA